MVQRCVFTCILLALSACEHHRKLTPITIPSVGLMCENTREVWCEWGNPHCGDLELAIEEINSIIPNLLVYKGEVPREKLIEMINNHSRPVTAMLQVSGVPEDKYPDMPIAVTTLKLDEWTTDVCLPNVPILIVWPAQALNASDWRQVILHELMHSLGAGHALPDSPFKTVMRPAVSLEHRVGLSMTDKNWLRAVYGQ